MLVPDVRYTTLVIKAEASDTGQKNSENVYSFRVSVLAIFVCHVGITD